MRLDDQVTVLIPTSPIPRHPDTGLIVQVIDSIRYYLPSVHLIVMVDGIRPQIEHRRAQYDGYKTNLTNLKDAGRLGDAELLIFDEYSQQAIMTREALKRVQTPLILFCEHDAVFRTEPPAPKFPAIFNLLLSGGINLVRFYNWADIWHEHEYLMRGEMEYEGSRFVKTCQYSQWPLVSRADYHRHILDRYFKMGQRSMIESGMYGPVAASRWEEHKIVIYLDGTLVFRHYDGRTDEKTGKRDPSEW